LQALLERELLGPGAREHHVWRSLHDQPRELDRAAHVPHAGDGAGPEVAPVHHRGVELVQAVGCDDCAAPGVEQRFILQHLHCGHRGVERIAAGVEDRESRAQGALEAGAIGALVLRGQVGGRERSGAAVNGYSVHRRSAYHPRTPGRAGWP
jgi:hypothetical protein